MKTIAFGLSRPLRIPRKNPLAFSTPAMSSNVPPLMTLRPGVSLIFAHLSVHSPLTDMPSFLVRLSAAYCSAAKADRPCDALAALARFSSSISICADEQMAPITPASSSRVGSGSSSSITSCCNSTGTWTVGPMRISIRRGFLNASRRFHTACITGGCDKNLCAFLIIKTVPRGRFSAATNMAAKFIVLAPSAALASVAAADFGCVGTLTNAAQSHVITWQSGNAPMICRIA